MNREQAIERARNLRKGTRVAQLHPAQGAEKAHWEHHQFESVGAAKRKMRELGCGVALLSEESLPKEGEVA